MKFKTKLWKRSKKSWATTIPHIALLEMDEDKDYEVEWEFNKELGKWTFSLKEIEPAKPDKPSKKKAKAPDTVSGQSRKADSKRKASAKEVVRR